jgi:Ca2+:H+ antiporter
MQRIKSEARQLAWKTDESGNYNPFAKWHPRPSQSDPEKGGPSEASAIGGIMGASANPHHATSLNTTDNIERSSPPDTNETSPTVVDSSGSENSRVNTSLPYSPNNRANSTTPSGPRSRKKKHNLKFWKKNQDEDDSTDMQRTTTSQSRAPQKFTLVGQLRAAVFGSWVNVLLICVPIGIALQNVGANGIAVFVVNFLAIIPLAGILSYATEEIAMRVGETIGGLLNASFGNAVELIVSILALVKNEILIVKTSLIGSMLSNLLLVLGMCFFFGGLKREEQFFNVTVAQTAASLLALAVGSLVIPTIFHDWGTAGTPELRESKIPQLSHGVALLLLFVYGCYLYFQLKTHSTMFSEPSKKVPMRKSSKVDKGAVHRGIAAMGAGSAAHGGGALFNKESPIFNPNGNRTEQEIADDDDEEEVPKLSAIGAVVTLCVATAFVGVCAEYMVDGISAVTATGKVSPEFIGLILIPIVGNAAEHATAVTVAIKDKMDLAIGVAVGSSLQIALLVLQLMVVIGWGMGNDEMNLEFDG